MPEHRLILKAALSHSHLTGDDSPHTLVFELDDGTFAYKHLSTQDLEDHISDLQLGLLAFHNCPGSEHGQN